MRALTATGQVPRLRLSAVVLASLVLAGAASAQQIQLGFGGAAQAELTAPHVTVVSGPTAARLEQARALAADENWDEAVDIYRELAADDTDRVVALDDRRYVSLRTYCHLQLARLPAEALAAYRRRVDPLAERWYREGLAARDERLLRRVVDELFCSSWGDDALLALGELALERADYAAARRWWERISPQLRAPGGLPLWLALRDVDLDARWPEIEQRSQPPEWLAYPDTRLDLADVRARLILVPIRAGQLDRAALELDVFRGLHPDAVGRLGGQEGPYVTALERLLTSAGEWAAEPGDGEWPTFAGSPTRSHVAAPLGPIDGPAWQRPVSLTASNPAPTSTRIRVGGGLTDERPQFVGREAQRPLSCFPIVVDGIVVFADETAIRAVNLATGQPAVTASGVLHRHDSPAEPQAIIRRGPAFVISGGSAIAHGVPRHTLTAADGVVYGRVGRLATTRLDARSTVPGARLVGHDLSRDGLLAFSRRAPDAAWSFDGVPVSDGRRLFVAMRHSDVTPHVYVACYDAATGTQLWRTAIGAADTPAAGHGDEITHNLLTLVGNRIYFNTNLGLVAALDAADGRIVWLHRYERLSGPFTPGPTGPLHFERDPAPCLYHDGLVIFAPADAPTVFALDAETGHTVWTTDEMPDALHLLGVVEQNLVLGGHRLRIVDVRSGAVRFVWPESEQVGVRGMGRGLVAGDEIFWPTRNEIYVFSVLTGERTRPPISLRSISDHGANLAAAHGYLIVAAPDKLIAFGPREN